MAFIQIIEMRTDRAEELQALNEEWQQATEGKRTIRRAIVTRDRSDPQRHLVLAFFDSYESAMENSQLPETTQMGEKQQALLEAPPVFSDLDVIEDRDLTAG
jgi:quinol monooxygenase YgiN